VLGSEKNDKNSDPFTATNFHFHFVIPILCYLIFCLYFAFFFLFLLLFLFSPSLLLSPFLPLSSSPFYSSLLWSISPTFYEQLLRRYSFTKQLQSQYVSREMLRKALLFKKGTSKMLIKFTTYSLQSSIFFLCSFFCTCISFS